MGQQKNTITINGKVYDAKTGSLARGSGVGLKSKPHPKTLDGFVRRHTSGQSQPIKSAQAQKLNEQSRRPRQPHPTHASHEIHKGHEHAKTLVRSGVKKPKSLHPSALSGRIEPSADLAEVDVPFKTLSAHERLQRATATRKSSLIKRFNPSAEPSHIVETADNLEVKQQPQAVDNRRTTALAAVATASVSSSSNLFAKALSQAHSHEQKAPTATKRRHRAAKKMGVSNKVLNIGASVMVVLVLGSFIAYQNWSNIALKLAANKAGVHASLPGYKPSGFAFSHSIESAPGKIVLSFNSNSDERSFKLSQAASNWNSQTLLDNFVATTDQPYQQVNQQNGKTVFVYGDANATWVDGGLWYKIEGNSGLSSDQLLKIANSL